MIANPLAWKLEVQRVGLAGDKHLVFDSLIQRILVGRNALFQFEQPVCIPIHLVLGSGRQPNQKRIEVFEDVAKFLIDGPVRFVDHHEVKVAWPEAMF